MKLMPMSGEASLRASQHKRVDIPDLHSADFHRAQLDARRLGGALAVVHLIAEIRSLPP